jgi:hypothetical protein
MGPGFDVAVKLAKFPLIDNFERVVTDVELRCHDEVCPTEEFIGMRAWLRYASDAAAVSFGFRHSGLFTTLQVAGGALLAFRWLTRFVIVPLTALAGAVSLVWYLWGTAPHVTGTMLLAAGIVLSVAVVVVALARPAYRWWRRWRYGYYW